MALSMAMPWHEGEEKMHYLMRVPEQDNPTASTLTAQAANMLQRGPLIAVGALDEQMRPWTTVWGGSPGLSQPLGGPVVGIKTIVDRKHDPVIDILFGKTANGEMVQQQGPGPMVSGLTIDLVTRKRVKIYGRMVAGAVTVKKSEESVENSANEQMQVQLVLKIDQSLGNCPKYLNRKEISPAPISSHLAHEGPDLPEDAIELVRGSDLFFLSSSHGNEDMDTNHRGGPAGFVRVSKTDSSEWQLVWPEYSGNRLYQTLGNLQSTPKAGLVFVGFESGDVLYLTGRTEVLVLGDAHRAIPHSNLAVRVTVTDAKFVKQGLPFRGAAGETSPYNPKVRPLASEAAVVVNGIDTSEDNTAKLLSKEQITPTISRYRFTMSNPTQWKAGQWVALDFSEELDIGYSHMRDDDPLSINEDFIRTFTVSSPPAPQIKRSDDEFEITIREVGRVTKFLSRRRQDLEFEIPSRGFGGDYRIEQDSDGKKTPVVAGGIGITPLMAQLPELDLNLLKVFYTLHIDDVDLAAGLLEGNPDAGPSFSVFVTGTTEENLHQKQNALDKIRRSGATVELRRLQKDDLDIPDLGNKWFVCTGPTLKTTLMQWLSDKEIVSEDFNF